MSAPLTDVSSPEARDIQLALDTLSIMSDWTDRRHPDLATVAGQFMTAYGEVLHTIPTRADAIIGRGDVDWEERLAWIRRDYLRDNGCEASGWQQGFVMLAHELISLCLDGYGILIPAMLDALKEDP